MFPSRKAPRYSDYNEEIDFDPGVDFELLDRPHTPMAGWTPKEDTPVRSPLNTKAINLEDLKSLPYGAKLLVVHNGKVHSEVKYLRSILPFPGPFGVNWRFKVWIQKTETHEWWYLSDRGITPYESDCTPATYRWSDCNYMLVATS